MVHSYPPDCIPLGEAFEKAVLALGKVHRKVELIHENEFLQRSSAEIEAAFSRFDEHEQRRRIVERMRDAIVVELELRVYVWDPATGYQLLYIDAAEWIKMTTMSFGLPGLESVDTEGRLRLLKNSEFNEWLASAESAFSEAQAVRSDEVFEKVSQEAGGVSSSEPAGARVVESAPLPPPADGITSKPRAAQAVDEELLPRKAAATYLSDRGYHVQPKTLANWGNKKGPPFMKLGGKSLRYKRSELDDWIRGKAASGDIDSQKK